MKNVSEYGDCLGEELAIAVMLETSGGDYWEPPEGCVCQVECNLNALKDTARDILRSLKDD